MLPQLQGLGEGLFEKTAISGVAFISTQWAEFCKPVYPFTCTTSKTLLILTQQTSHSSISLNFNTGNILPFHPIKYKYIGKPAGDSSSICCLLQLITMRTLDAKTVHSSSSNPGILNSQTPFLFSQTNEICPYIHLFMPDVILTLAGTFLNRTFQHQ